MGWICHREPIRASNEQGPFLSPSTSVHQFSFLSNKRFVKVSFIVKTRRVSAHVWSDQAPEFRSAGG